MKVLFLEKGILLLLCFLCLFYCRLSAHSGQKKFWIEIENSSSFDREFEPITLSLNQLTLPFQVRSVIVWEDKTELPSQLDDLDGDGKADELAFVISISAGMKKTVKVELSEQKKKNPYPSQVYAEMLISDKKGNHVPITSLTIPGSSNVYNQLHHHGPAFESELVAYRIYFDHKQTVDIYGKFNKGFEIQESQFYPTDEQLARGFGDDVLRVSGSCGLGTLKGWNGKKAQHISPVSFLTETIRSYGPVRTVVDVSVREWEYQNTEINMLVRYILYAGHRDCQVQVSFEEPLQEQVFATGVMKIKDSDSYSDGKGLLACWGTDWPVNDTVKYAKETVGLAVSLPQDIVLKEVTDNINYLYVIQAIGRKEFTYHITFTSLKETFGYKTKEEWFAHVEEWKKRLQAPCRISIRF